MNDKPRPASESDDSIEQHPSFPQRTNLAATAIAATAIAATATTATATSATVREAAAAAAAADTETANHRRVLWWIICCVAAVVLIPLISVFLGLHLHVRDFQYPDDQSTFDGRTIMFEVILITADPMASTLTLDWSIIGESQSNCTSTNLDACTDINIFFDSNLLRNAEPGSLQTNNRPTKPIFRFNASAFAVFDIVGNTPTFRTHLSLFSKGASHPDLLYYPFDSYSAEIFIFALDAKTNETLGLRLAQTRGIAVGFQTSAYTRPGVNIPAGMVDIIVTLSRDKLVKTYSIIATISVWLITIILLLVMITSVFFGFEQKGEVLVVPVATLFAFTQLRQSMPGAPPGFGDIVDFVGLLPCLALLSLSASFTLGAFILTDPTNREKQTALQDGVGNWSAHTVRRIFKKGQV